MEYNEFLKRKQVQKQATGITVDLQELNSKAFEWQRFCTKWALEQGKAALFEDCGLGKTLQQLMWADKISKANNKPVLILAPLAVAPQTKQEGVKFGIDVNICDNMADVKNGINITNYEKLDKFNANSFCGIVLDESSILKSYMGKTKRLLVDKFKDIPYKLACTATPAPNDLMELLNHAEFLNIMRSSEALAIWFIADQKQSGKYRLKGHAKKDFWNWVAQWAMCISKPSDIGYSDSGYKLSGLEEIDVVVDSLRPETAFEDIVRVVDVSATGYHKERRRTLKARTQKTAEIVNNSNEQFVVWCGLNDEADELKKLFGSEAVEVRGSDKSEKKEKAAIDFQSGKVKILISKPSIFGYGLNFQNCHNTVFCGMDYSFENYYQAVRRFYRFGQKDKVKVYRVLGDTEKNILETVNRKAEMKSYMQSSMADVMRDIQTKKHSFILDLTDNKYKMPIWVKGE